MELRSLHPDSKLFEIALNFLTAQRIEIKSTQFTAMVNTTLNHSRKLNTYIGYVLILGGEMWICIANNDRSPPQKNGAFLFHKIFIISAEKKSIDLGETK
jgi:hypothetical protein